MRCAMCGRWMDKAYTHIGNMALGPKCAERAGLSVSSYRVKSISQAKLNDSDTLDMFDESDERGSE